VEPDTKQMTVEQLFARMEGLEFGPEREQFLSSLDEKQKVELNEYIGKKNPNMLLMAMACKGDLKMVKEAVHNGADVNYHANTDSKDSVLMMACWFCKPNIVEFLLEQKGIDVHYKNTCNQSAIHYASMKGFIKIIKVLLAAGSSLEVQDSKGYTPIICAAQFGHTAVMDYYKRKGANLFHRDGEDHTILHWTAYNKHPLATSWILNEGVDIHLQDSRGRTAIHWAAKQGNSDILKLLVEFVDEEGFTALINEPDGEGKSPLELAKYYENYKATGYLKEVLRRQKGCMAVWNKITCQSGIRPGENMRKTAKMVSGWLIIVMAISMAHAWFVLRPYSPTVPEACFPALLVMTLLCYVLWFACNCVDPGYIEPKPGSTAYRKMAKKKKTMHTTRNTSSGGYVSTHDDNETEMKLFDEDEDEDGEDDLEIALDMKTQTVLDKYPEDAPAWTLPYDVLLERGRFDAICVTCGIVKPLRSKHCKHCNRCVSRFDHHCPWIDNCVAENNRKQFVLLAVVQTTSTWFYAVLCGIHMQHHSCSDALAFTLSLPLMIHACLVATWGLALAQEHVSLALKNITTNEKMNQHRYSYMRDEHGNPKNPFDLGARKNCLYFFGCMELPGWRELGVNTKFLPPGKGGCCSAHAGHSHGGNHGHAHGQPTSTPDDPEATKVGDAESPARLSENRESESLLLSNVNHERNQDVEVGAGVGL